ncbi:MAG: HD domain-containing protein [Deltaproteobacteria bacterium]|nr:HD domain-containing protein [Deltaproteobacteria bacterium]
MKCPGQDSRYWKENAIFEVKCPKCNAEVEFFKDDTTRRCGKCGHKFLNPQLDFGCASYCKYAEQCIGTLSPELLAQKEDLLKDRVAIEMKRFFKQDFRKIGHARRTARYAEEIGRGENANPAVILTASYLHNVGWEHTAGAGDSPEAREILEKLGAREELTDEVMAILEHIRRGTPTDNADAATVQDACTIAMIEEELKTGSPAPSDLKSRIDNTLDTESGRKLAKKVLME